MKKLLFLLCLPCFAHAQKYELVLGAGISTNSSNGAYSSSSRYAGGTHTVNPSGLLSVYRNITSHFQLGISFNPTTLTYKERLNVMSATSFPDSEIWNIKTIIANPAIPVLLSGNYKWRKLYGGIGIGYLFPIIIESKKSAAPDFYEYSKSQGGVVYNIHAGYVQKITSRFSLDISASYNNATFTSSKTFRGGAINYYNIIAGIRMGIK